MLRLSRFSDEIDEVLALVRRGALDRALSLTDECVAAFGQDPDTEAYWRYQILRLQVLGYAGHRSSGSLLCRELTSEPPTVELKIALRILRASAYCSGGRYRQASELIEQAVQEAADCGLTALEAEANVRRGFLFYQLNRFQESEQYYRRALELGTGLNDKYLQAIAMAGIGKNIMRNGRFAEATQYFRELRQIANELGELLFSAMLACEIGWGHMNQRDFVPALNALLEAEPVLRNAGLKHLHGICEADIGYIYLQWGSYSIAVSYFQRALATATAIGDVVSERKWSQNLGIAYSKLGDEEMSQRYVQDTLRREAALAAERAEVT